MKVIQNDITLNKESFWGACSCCGSKFNTVCDRLLSRKCRQCREWTCRQCTWRGRKRELCKICHRERYLDLYSEEVNVLKAKDLKQYSASQIHGSHLVLKSLVNTDTKEGSELSDTGKQQADQTFLKPRTRSGFKRCSLPQIPASATSPVMNTQQHKRVPSIDDPNSGFKLVSSGASNEQLAECSSLYSEPNYEDKLKVSGNVRFAVWYRNDEKILYVKIVNASDLAAANGESINPYIKVHLLPDKSKHTKRKTGIQRKTAHPEYNETVKYKLSREELSTTTLWLSVWNWDFMGRNKFLGEVLLPLYRKNFDLSSSRVIKYPLKEHEADIEGTDYELPPGKLYIALKYEFLSDNTQRMKRSVSLTPETHTPAFPGVLPVSPVHSPVSHSPVSHSLVSHSLVLSQYLGMPKLNFARASISSLPQMPDHGSSLSIRATTGRLHVLVISAENLPPVDSTGDTNPFVRCYLLPSSGVKGKRKTSIVPKSLNPVWEEECAYNMIKVDDLQSQRVLEVSVWDSDRRGSNSFIGGLRLGPAPPDDGEGPEWMDSTGEEVSHWDEMLANTGVWVKRWHNLRPSMASRQAKKTPLDIESIDESPTAQASQPLAVETAAPVVVVPSAEAPSTAMELILRRRRGKGHHYQISGEIVLDVVYQDKHLMVKIFRAEGLAAVNRTSSDPYVKLYLLPDMTSKKKTKTMRKTLDPSYDQTFTYKVPECDLPKYSLWVTVWSHSGIFQHREFLGETCIVLESYKFESSFREVAYKLCDYTSHKSVPDVNSTSEGSDQEATSNTDLTTLGKEKLLVEPVVDGSLSTHGSDQELPVKVMQSVSTEHAQEAVTPITGFVDVTDTEYFQGVTAVASLPATPIRVPVITVDDSYDERAGDKESASAKAAGPLDVKTEVPSPSTEVPSPPPSPSTEVSLPTTEASGSSQTSSQSIQPPKSGEKRAMSSNLAKKKHSTPRAVMTVSASTRPSRNRPLPKKEINYAMQLN